MQKVEMKNSEKIEGIGNSKYYLDILARVSRPNPQNIRAHHSLRVSSRYFGFTSTLLNWSLTNIRLSLPVINMFTSAVYILCTTYCILYSVYIVQCTWTVSIGHTHIVTRLQLAHTRLTRSQLWLQVSQTKSADLGSCTTNTLFLCVATGVQIYVPMEIV